MANTYTQLYIQIVLTVKGRQNILPEKHKEEIHKYITGVIQNRNHKLTGINSVPDHIHIFIGYKPSQSLPELVRDIKANSSKFINENHWIAGKFEWQSGYGAFSYLHSHIERVIKYIANQEEHHKKSSFREEYLKLLHKFDIQYDDKYLFNWID